MSTHPAFHRAELLLGTAAQQALADCRVIIFGIGGVGSWCAEALIRSGVGHLTIVDNDVVCITNVNRQLQATVHNVGRSKVEALKERLQSISPDAEIQALEKTYNQDTRDSFELATYDYVVDAIDSLTHKVDLIATAMGLGVTLYSAMGAACKLDPSAIRVDSIWNSKGCKLASVVRKRLRRRAVTGDCLCIYSEEFIPPEKPSATCGSDPCVSPKKKGEEGDGVQSDTAQINGSMVHMTGIYGFHLAGLIIQDVYQKNAPTHGE
jgi:tRNA A37 threonylcarbamoyladenosine dehydratase